MARQTFFDRLLKQSKTVRQVGSDEVIPGVKGGFSPIRQTSQWQEIEQAFAHAEELRPQESYAWRFSQAEIARMDVDFPLAAKRLIKQTLARMGKVTKHGRAWTFPFDWRVVKNDDGSADIVIIGRSEVA